MTQDGPGDAEGESRRRQLRHLADEGLITAEEYRVQLRRIGGEDGESGASPSRADGEADHEPAMYGRAITLLDKLISTWSRWDQNERYYLDDLAPRIVRSDDPDFRWMEMEEERVTVTRLRALMSPGEWQVLPELLQARREMELDDLDSDTARAARFSEQERARHEAEPELREAEAWVEVVERARQNGETRLRRAREAEVARLDVESSDREREAALATRPGRDDAKPPLAPDADLGSGTGDLDEPVLTAEATADQALAGEEATGGAAIREAVTGEVAAGETVAGRGGGRGRRGPTRRWPEEAVPGEAAAGQDASESDEPSRPNVEEPPSPGAAPRTVPAGHNGPNRAHSIEKHLAIPGGSSPRRPGRAVEKLRGFARRLRDAGSPPLADVVSAYAERVRAVERGELPAAMNAVPAAVEPEMVGAALAQSRLEPFVDHARSLLIFMPVLWTWLKLWSAVSAYRADSLQGESFFDFWVRGGGRWGVLGGTLQAAALQVVVVLFLLIALNFLLSVLRRRVARERALVGREFAVALSEAETAGAASRIADPQTALEGFVHASTELSANLRSVGELLRGSVVPFADSVGVAQETLREMSAAVARQERQLAEVMGRLDRVAQIGDHLGALQREFADAQAAALLGAEALSGIRDSLEPSARDFAASTSTLGRLAEQFERMTENMAGAIAGLESGLDSSSAHLEEAASSMRTVSTRVLDELGGDGGARV